MHDENRQTDGDGNDPGARTNARKKRASYQMVIGRAGDIVQDIGFVGLAGADVDDSDLHRLVRWDLIQDRQRSLQLLTRVQSCRSFT